MAMGPVDVRAFDGEDNSGVLLTVGPLAWGPFGGGDYRPPLSPQICYLNNQNTVGTRELF